MPTETTGPMETYFRSRRWAADADAMAKARQYDAAFAAMESALRELNQAADTFWEDVCEDDMPDVVLHRMSNAMTEATAALALAEGVRS